MNTYELTLLFPEGADTEKARVMKMVEDFLKKHKGELLKQESWGVKHTAYLLGRAATADYEHFSLALDPTNQPDLDRLLSLDETVMRHLFVRV